MGITEDVKKFWENKHKLEDVAALSGCLCDETIDFLDLRAYIIPGINVLEVGVGLGYVTEGLFNNKVKVSALDISDEALERVSTFCENVYLVSDIDKLPSDYYDVIICNNVVQHIPTKDLVIELNEIMRALKSTGVFAVEFVSSEDFDDNGDNPILSDIQNGELCRTPAYLEEIFRQFGGKCSLVFNKKVDIGIVKGHHIFHIKKIKGGQTL